jgi:hypothetical protein
MNHAASLKGSARYAAYGALDNSIQKNYAPIAGIDNRNDREYFSARVAVPSIVQSPIYEIDLGKLALK